ncbi:TetR/AcrR family transcriptional regulator [Paenarthrobacter sp. NPDC057981]|uniref:TetR/AcrR family transcriptional regulator n=1 Tax=Paenarthrobacter sp. NPDC057981 TaxID=3346297 RepID=UPI0036DE4083
MKTTNNHNTEASGRRRPAREKLLQSAAKLFYADGLASTGIDAVTADAGVAKMSLYNNFASKADLVAAYLNERHEEWLGLYRRRRDAARTPIDRLLAVFDAYTDHAHFEYERGFRGCGLLNAAAELPVGDPGRNIVKVHKEEVEGLLAGHLTEIAPQRGARNAATARQLSFLLEGAMARAGLEGNDECLAEARSMAKDLVAAL